MPKKDNSENLWKKPLQVFAKISGWVAGPVILALFIGRYLDGKFGTKPYIFIGLTGFAFLVSCFGIYRETMKYMKELEEQHGTRNTNNSDNT